MIYIFDAILTFDLVNDLDLELSTPYKLMYNYFCNIRVQSWCFICCKHIFKKVITN